MIQHDLRSVVMTGEGVRIDPITTLTQRQMDVLRIVATGKSDKQTGLLLSISRETVRKHINNARQKLGVDNRIQLIVAWAQWQVTEGKEP